MSDIDYNLPKADGTYRSPYSQDATDSYAFPAEDFPTREDVVAYLTWTGEWGGDWDWDILDPAPTPIHDHDEDFACPGDACPHLRSIECWWVS